MTSIGTQLNSMYYQLSNLGAGTNDTKTLPNAADALLQMLSATNNGATGSGDDAFLLDLSPQAQQILSGINGGAFTGDPLSGFNNNFFLSGKQQDQVTAILDKYKDAPYTQDTFNQIQNDLEAAGLGTT